MSAHDGGWLSDLAGADELDLQEAAGLVVENGITLTAEDWRSLGTDERAALTVARRAARDAARALALKDAGDDLAAAAAYVSVDGGRAAARLMAQAAGQGVAEARRQAKSRAP